MPKISELPTDTAPDVADTIPFVDVTAARTEQVTVDNLAASAAFSGRYGPLAGETMLLPATDFQTYDGSPVLASPGGLQFDAAANEGVISWRKWPSGWATYDMYVWWYNAGAGTGNVRWVVYTQSLSDGTTLAPYTASTVAVVAAGVEDVLTVSKLTSSPLAVSGTGVSVLLYRDGAVGTDTLANDAGALGLELRRVS